MGKKMWEKVSETCTVSVLDQPVHEKLSIFLSIIQYFPIKYKIIIIFIYILYTP